MKYVYLLRQIQVKGTHQTYQNEINSAAEFFQGRVVSVFASPGGIWFVLEVSLEIYERYKDA